MFLTIIHFHVFNHAQCPLEFVKGIRFNLPLPCRVSYRNFLVGGGGGGGKKSVEHDCSVVHA